MWKHFEERNIDHTKVWEDIQQVCLKTIQAVDGPLNASTKTHMRGTASNHELFGFDVILDDNLKVSCVCHTYKSQMLLLFQSLFSLSMYMYFVCAHVHVRLYVYVSSNDYSQSNHLPCPSFSLSIILIIHPTTPTYPHTHPLSTHPQPRLHARCGCWR